MAEARRPFDQPRRPLQIELERRGLYLLGVALAFLAAGLLARKPLVMGFGAVVLGGLVFSYVRVLLASLRGDLAAIRVRCAPPVGSRKIHVVGEPMTLPVTVENHLPHDAGASHVELALSSTLAIETDDDTVTGPIPAGGAASVDVPVRPVAAGTWFVHGAHVRLSLHPGLLAVRTYVPVGMPLKVLPRHAFRSSRATLALRRTTTRTPTRDDGGGAQSRARGFGTDIKELREHAPGDPFKHIAWKATARTGKLIVKEFESNVTLSVYLLLDTGPSMRWGTPGRTLLDRTTDVAFSLAQEWTRAGTRFGLCAYDSDVWSFTRAADGRRNLFALADQLLEAHNSAREQVTAVTDEELVAKVGEYALTQWGRDFRVRPVPEMMGVPVRRSLMGRIYDDGTLSAFVSEVIAHEAEHGAKSWLHRDARFSADPRLNDLRLLCRLQGIELPFRSASLDGEGEQGLASALSKVLTAGAGPHTVVVLSDLLEVGQAEPVARAVKALHKRKDRVVFLLQQPDPDDALPPAKDPLEHTLRGLLHIEALERRRRIVSELRSAGATILPGDGSSTRSRGGSSAEARVHPRPTPSSPR